MAYLLTIETSETLCSLCLTKDGQVLSQSSQPGRRQQADLLLPAVHELLQASGKALSDLDAIGVSVGPGAFTGVRIGIAMAQGLAYGLNLPVAPIPTLKGWSVAGFAAGYTQVICASDARLNEVYMAAYDLSLIHI